MSSDWFPRKRELQLSMAKTWCGEIGANAGNWNIPGSVLAEFQPVVADAEDTLARAKNPLRNVEDTARCNTAFDRLEAAMRDIKRRYFNMPPLTGGGFTALGLRVRDTVKTAVPAPSAQAEADVSYPGPHLLKLHIQALSHTHADPRADHGRRIYYGVMPQGGASVEQATGHSRYLMRQPSRGDDLPHSKFTRKRKETFEFPATDSGSTAWFCIRVENSKGEAGPWGPLFSAVIP